MAFRKKDPAEKIAELEQREQQIRNQLKRERAKLSAEKRKRETRRKIIAGALALEHKDQAFQATLQHLIAQYVTKPDERALFGLDPLPDHAIPE